VQLDAPVGADNFGLDRCSAAMTQWRSPPRQERSAMGTNERHLALRSAGGEAARTRGSHGIP
jgi:hypothetical protein